jgi:hypothetical protein
MNNCNKTDYSNTIIFKITCKDPSIKDIYIGHTVDFVSRKESHKNTCTNPRSSGYNYKVYQIIRQYGGWNNWSMNIVAFFNCKHLSEAKEKEQEYYELLGGTLNSVEPKRHKQVNKVKNTFNCILCNKLLIGSTAHNNHLKSKNHFYKINNFNLIFDNKNNNNDDNNNNNKNNKNIELYKYYCELCNIKFCNKANLSRHYQSKTHISKIYININDYYSNLKKNFILYNCDKCNYKTHQKVDWDYHINCNKHIKKINKKEGDKAYICNNCNKQYNSYNGLWKHKQKCINK